MFHKVQECFHCDSSSRFRVLERDSSSASEYLPPPTLSALLDTITRDEQKCADCAIPRLHRDPQRISRLTSDDAQPV
jgi:hypothetical protein